MLMIRLMRLNQQLHHRPQDAREWEKSSARVWRPNKLSAWSEKCISECTFYCLTMQIEVQIIAYISFDRLWNDHTHWGLATSLSYSAAIMLCRFMAFSHMETERALFYIGGELY